MIRLSSCFDDEAKVQRSADLNFDFGRVGLLCLQRTMQRTTFTRQIAFSHTCRCSAALITDICMKGNFGHLDGNLSANVDG